MKDLKIIKEKRKRGEKLTDKEKLILEKHLGKINL